MIARSSGLRPLYVMAKPPAEIASLLHAEPRADPRRVDRSHITLLPIGDIGEPLLLERTMAVMADFAATPCRVVFDRIHCSGRTVALRGSETMRGILRLQSELCLFLSQGGVPLPDYRFHPHITLRYRPDGQGTQAIDPISWQVRDICLIESVVGEGRHILHGRWPLRAHAAVEMA